MACLAQVEEDHTLPTLEPHEILMAIEQVDPSAYHKLMVSVGTEDSASRPLLMQYLKEWEPRLFSYLSDLETMYQEGTQLTHRAAYLLKHNYLQWRHLRESHDNYIEGLEREKSPEKGQKKSAPKRGREEKKNPEPAGEKISRPNPNDSATPPPPEREPFSDAFPLSKYVELVKKGTKKIESRPVEPTDCWFWVYHTASKWEAETLVAEMEEKHVRAILIKLRRGGADLECMAFKVLTGPQADDPQPTIIGI